MSKFCEKCWCDWFTSRSVQAQNDKMTVANWGVAAEVLKRSRRDVQQLAFDVWKSFEDYSNSTLNNKWLSTNIRSFHNGTSRLNVIKIWPCNTSQCYWFNIFVPRFSDNEDIKCFAVNVVVEYCCFFCNRTSVNNPKLGVTKSPWTVRMLDLGKLMANYFWYTPVDRRLPSSFPTCVVQCFKSQL